MLHNRWKRSLVLLLAFILVLTLSPVVWADEQGTEEKKDSVNLVILIDSSGSMTETDAEKIAVEAAMMFIDNFRRGSSTVSVISFGPETQEVVRGTLETNDSTRYLTTTAGTMTYKRNTGTRIGNALISAVQVIADNASPDKSNLIVLFSDGENDADKENQIALQKEAINNALALNCPIYTVGVNYKNTMSAEGEQNLKDIASATGGESRIFPDMSQVRQYFQVIYNRYWDYEIPDPVPPTELTGEFQEKEITIPNSYISEANINLITDQGLAEFHIYDPDGNEVTDGDNAYFSVNRLYSTIKLFNPMKGNWKVRFRGLKGDHIYISFIPNYNWKLGEELSSAEVRIGEETTLTLFILFKAQRVRGDQEFYDSFLCDYQLHADDGSAPKRINVVPTPNGVELRFVPNAVTTYTLSAALSGPGVSLRSEEYRIRAVNTAPMATGTIPDIRLKLPTWLDTLLKRTPQTEAVVDLIGLFQDPDLQYGQTLNYKLAVSGDPDAFSAEIQDGKLLVKGLQTGKGAVTVTATDNAGASAQLDTSVSVSSAAKMIKIAIIAVAVLILLIILFFLLRILTRKLSGPLQAEVEDPRDDMDLSRPLINPIHLNGRSLTLFEYLRTYVQRYEEDYGCDYQNLKDRLADNAFKGVLESIVFCGVNGSDKRMEIKASFPDGGNNNAYISGNQLTKKARRLPVSAGDRVSITISYEGKELVIDLEYCPPEF